MEDLIETVSEVGQSVEPYAKVAQSLANLVKAFSGKKAADGTGVFSGMEFSELLEIVTAAQLAAIEAQNVQIRQSERIRELEEAIKRYDDWEREKQRYFLKQVGPAGYVLCLKDGFVRDDEPRHLICPTCAENARKTLMHQERSHSPYQMGQLKCPRCKTTIAFSSGFMNRS